MSDQERSRVRQGDMVQATSILKRLAEELFVKEYSVDEQAFLDLLMAVGYFADKAMGMAKPVMDASVIDGTLTASTSGVTPDNSATMTVAGNA